MTFFAPAPDCNLCPRLQAFRFDNGVAYPGFFNAPVPAFGDLAAKMLVVGLAPGLKGANATGRPFTGDYAGDLLYESLLRMGFASGSYSSPRGVEINGTYRDKLVLENCRITNAVRCVPPENKPETSEIRQCNGFLREEIRAMPNLKVILCLGLVSHQAVLRACGLKPTAYTFVHAAQHTLPGGHILLDSYHCSRYNVNTGRLTQAMFDDVVKKARELVHVGLAKAI